MSVAAGRTGLPAGPARASFPRAGGAPLRVGHAPLGERLRGARPVEQLLGGAVGLSPSKPSLEDCFLGKLSRCVLINVL